MAEENIPNFSDNDPLDINELASLNDDISVDFIEQLQNKLSKEVGELSGKNVEDSVSSTEEVESKPLNLRFDDSIDDNFIKKYRAKLNKQQTQLAEQEAQKKEEIKPVEAEPPVEPVSAKVVAPTPTPIPIPEEPVEVPVFESLPEPVVEITPVQVEEPQSVPAVAVATVVDNKEIEALTSGSIVEKIAEEEQLEYNDSLDFLDGNVKYSKYVIYVDPENTEFIDSLTVKERKNLINRILREQDDIAITKRRLNLVQTIIKHSVVAIITIAVSIPIVYHVINASLEASINNHRRTESMFKTLLNEQGKLKKTPASRNLR